MACVRPHLSDEPVKKRRRLTSSWDVLPSGLKAQETLDSSGQFIANIKQDVNEAEPSLFNLSLKSKGNQQLSHYLSPPWRQDDKEGHYVFALGDNLTSRCAFGQVLECWDRKSNDIVAIKITRGLQKFQEEAMMEINVLHEVGRHDKTGKRSKVKILKAGAIPILVDFMQSENVNLRESAATTILTLSTSSVNKVIIGASGATPLLVEMLTSGSPQVKGGCSDGTLQLVNLLGKPITYSCLGGYSTTGNVAEEL